MIATRRRLTDDPRFDWVLLSVAALLTIVYTVLARRLFSSWNPDLKDYTMWYDHILQFGRWRSLNGSFASYNPPYIYVLALASNLSGLLQPVSVIKLLNLPFMLASGALAYSICQAVGCSRRRSLVAGWLIAVAPEVIANAIVWGQTDILETTFVLAFLRLLIARRFTFAMAALGVALSFKLQVIFLAPAVLALLLTRELPVLSLLGVPAGYLCMMLPAELAGRSYTALYGVYSAQAGTSDRITMGAANLYAIVVIGTGNGRVDAQHPFFVELTRAGIVLAAIATVFLIRYVLRFRPLLQGRRLLLVVTISALAEPFLLPKMHDRYFYIGDTLALLLGCLVPPMLLPATLLQMAALMVYGRYLVGFQVPLWYYAIPALFVAVAIFLLLRELRRSAAEATSATISTSASLASAAPSAY